MQLFSEAEGGESTTDVYTFIPSNFELESRTTFIVLKHGKNKQRARV